MTTTDDLTTYLGDRLEGTYDCADRITVRGYYPLGQSSGGLLTWWNQLFPNTALTEERLRKLAGDFGRRVNGYARKHKITLRYCATGEKDKHAQAEKLRPADAKFRGIFAILVSKAPGLVWQAKNNREGKVVLRRPTSWPLVYHYHFHIVDPEWGHVTIRMSGHPPFGLQISLNGHEWIERQARKQALFSVKQDNCFVGGSDRRSMEWPSGWTASGGWRAWAKWWIAGCIRRACVLHSTSSNKSVRAFATSIRAIS